jgi:hypothetical protein
MHATLRRRGAARARTVPARMPPVHIPKTAQSSMGHVVACIACGTEAIVAATAEGYLVADATVREVPLLVKPIGW